MIQYVIMKEIIDKYNKIEYKNNIDYESLDKFIIFSWPWII